MGQLILGVLGESAKEHEYRLPLHPDHFDRIDDDLRPRVLVEEGYGERYGTSDDEIAPFVGGMPTRQEIIAGADIILLPKPTLAEVEGLRDGQVLWGWPHCVQDADITQLAIDKRLTVIAWEAMNHWTENGSFEVHVFRANNELAGYCSVMHALSLEGRTGHYGRRLSAAVIGFGNSARGAVTGLTALGVQDVTVLTTRDVTAVASPIPSVTFHRMERLDDSAGRTVVHAGDGSDGVETAGFLADFDLVVNCVLQDTDDPLMFVTNEELALFRPGSVLVDVSCDEGMGFECAVPTTFSDPMFTAGNGVRYYGVDHSPAYLWNSATWEISSALLPFLRCVMAGPDNWNDEETIHKAIEIRHGVVQNPKILSFQGRAAEYPHARK
jgi:alanine dehydrogenase